MVLLVEAFVGSGGLWACWRGGVWCARAPGLISVRGRAVRRAGDVMVDGVFPRDAVRPLGLWTPSTRWWRQRSHRRIERRAAVAVLPIGAIERGEVHPFDRLNHKPREVPLGQPVAHVRRQQKALLTIRRQEVLAHTGIVLTAPDRPPLCNSHHASSRSPSARSASTNPRGSARCSVARAAS